MTSPTEPAGSLPNRDEIPPGEVPEPAVEAPTPPQETAGVLPPSPRPPPRNHADVHPRRLHNPSAMLQRPSWLVRALWHTLFRSVAFEDLHVRTIRESADLGDVVFVMNNHSLLDYLYFNYAFLRHKLPLVFFANRISLVAWKPAWALIGRGIGRLLGRRRTEMSADDLLAYGLERGHPALLFLRRRGLFPWSSGQSDIAHLTAVVEAQLERIDDCEKHGEGNPRRLFVVPQLLVWNQNPDRYRRSLPDLVFGNPEAPGRVRKAINFILHRRQAFVQLGKPIDILEFITESDQPADAEELALKLRFRIRQSLSLEARVIKGPIIKDSARLRQEILRTPEMQAEILRISQEEGTSSQETTKEVSDYLRQMAANFSMAYVEGFVIGLTLLFDRLYNEVVCDQEGLEKVREAGRTAPLMLLPCHRSHVDYLVISYLFYANGLIPPHIAAGDNLAFFPLGHIFRRSGAFFLKRSFGLNEAYRITFREYLRKLLREGYWIEFFPEGGRSRSGKMLPPKLGMLTIIVDAIRSGATPDAKLVPIYVGYEKVIEEQAYSDELAGSTKKRESITALLKTTRVLWAKYGRLYVSFGDPFSVREAIDEAGVADLDSDDPRFLAFVRRLGYRVLAGIQDVALVTPSALLCLSLLMHPKRGIRREVLVRRVGFLVAMASKYQAPLSKTLQHALKLRRGDVVEALEKLDADGIPRDPLAQGQNGPVVQARGRAVLEAIDEVILRYAENGLIEVHDFGDEIVYTPVVERRVQMDFYKNNIVHLVMRDAVLAAAYWKAARSGATDEESLKKAAYFLSITFKYEFVYDPDQRFDATFANTLKDFEDAGLLVREPDPADPTLTRLHVPEDGPAEETLAILHQVLEPWLESYWLLATGLGEFLGPEQPEVQEKEFIRRLQDMARRRYHVGDISCPEAGSSVTFKHALGAYESLGYVKRISRGREKLLSLPSYEQLESEPVTELADRLRQYFHT